MTPDEKKMSILLARHIAALRATTSVITRLSGGNLQGEDPVFWVVHGAKRLIQETHEFLGSTWNVSPVSPAGVLDAFQKMAAGMLEDMEDMLGDKGDKADGQISS